MGIRISDKTDADDVLKVPSILFNGRNLIIYSMNKDQILAKYPEIYGLPSNSRFLSEIEDDRKELEINTDYA